MNKLVRVVLQTLSLIISNTAMIIFVVLSGQEYPNFQYSFAFILSIFTLIANLILHFIFHGLAITVWLHDCLFDFKTTGLIGFLWAFNYVFLLVSNPYVPGTIQTILNELNLIVVVVVSRFFLKSSYHIGQYIAVFLTLVGGLIPFFQADSTTKASHIPTWVWYIFYTVGTIPIALVNIRMQCILQKHRGEKVSVPLMYVVINWWTMWVVLALFWFPGMSDGKNMWPEFLLGIEKILSFSDMGSCWTWISMVISIISNLLTAYISRDEDATYATIVLALAPAIAGVIMGIKPLMGPYYTPLGWSVWVSMAIVMCSVLLYKFIGVYSNIRNASVNEDQKPINI